MQATLDHHVIAESDAIIETGGYAYFPKSAVRMEWLEKSPRTSSDLACPHGVQFYDVVIDGVRHERAAWSYEEPLARMKDVAHQFGFWKRRQGGLRATTHHARIVSMERRNAAIRVLLRPSFVSSKSRI